MLLVELLVLHDKACYYKHIENVVYALNRTPFWTTSSKFRGGHLQAFILEVIRLMHSCGVDVFYTPEWSNYVMVQVVRLSVR